MADDLIVTVVQTFQGGILARWHRSLPDAEEGRWLAEVSRYGVRVDGYLERVPADVLAQAHEAAAVLRSGGNPGPVFLLATHRRLGLHGPLELITKDGADVT